MTPLWSLPPSPTQVLAGIGGAIVVYFLGLWVYRLTLHPLAKYPGPFLYKLTDWSLIIQCYQGNRHLHHLRDHEKYGPIVRIGPNTLSFNTETALNAIYGSKKVNVRKTGMYITMDAGAGALSTHTEVDKEKHAYRRRVMSHAFSDNALRSAEPFILDNINIFCNLMAPKEKGAWSEAKDMSQWCAWLGFDIMGDLAFGKRFRCLESEEHRYTSRTTITGSKFIYWFSYLPCAWLCRLFITSPLLSLLFGQMAKDLAHLVYYADEQVRIRTSELTKSEKSGEKTAPRKDSMHYIIEARDPETGKSLTNQELTADSMLLIGAGSDTVATSMASCLFYLLHNPTVLKKVTTEVRSTFTSIADIRVGPKLTSCTYLQACLEEVLRITPPVPSHLPREVLPGGLGLDGEYIPAGTIVGVPAYSIHHNPTYYPDPWAFTPERWLVDPAGTGVTAAQVELAQRAFCPFSLGSRGCIGKFLAYMEFKLFMAHLLYRFDIKEGEEKVGGGGKEGLERGRERSDEFQMDDAFAVLRNGPMVRFRAV
ncbi:benzoate 4-monooxygenase cytochrome P450 [Lepidopterella palustris CBS 459.81]|uniref:Benzoate 4-monooxygenase cytochrome P450 n=1 Tax=Lepidopterella palustris CBS 459.81 TaxID=1314670 RepID=A0A8E2EH33_9PEZI|nr:benzoate 4-monooxygenase cytochrome P450 [Lepidopterella palustris CBS 459.81]